MVGSELKKLISGGERKRTAIGVELITDPKVVLLDEPTSGLDSFTALRICKTLQKLARTRNKTIVSTIHQPSSESFSCCDRLILLADGHIVFQGPGSESANYFQVQGKSMSKNRNPCDYFMRELSVDYPKSQEDEDKMSRYCTRYQQEQEGAIMNFLKKKNSCELDFARAGASKLSFGEQCRLLF